MEKELVFQILGISETRDEEEIRQAYRANLKNTNPEDDPDGFKRLRQAYEEALLLISQPENPEEENSGPKDEVDLWIDRVTELYQNLFLRHQAELWKELLADPVCEGLDTSLEAREKMIVFLLDHVHLPHEVWKAIDDTFEIISDIESLKEKYPINFLNYMKYYVENATFIPFELFAGRDHDGNISTRAEETSGYEEINGDGYIDEYLRIKRQIDNEEREGCLERLDDLKAFHVYHPYEDVERLRIFTTEERTEEGLALARKLLDQCGQDIYVCLHAGQSLWQAGEKDRAYELWKGILEQMPDHFMAKYYCVKHLMDKEEYFEARELLADLLEVDDRSEELRSYVHTANEALIQEFRQTLAEGREDPRLPGDELKIRLGWSLLQNEREEEALEVVESLQPEPDQEYAYTNLYSQLLYYMGRYEEAVPRLQKWIQLIEELSDDGTAETKKRMSRAARAHLLLCCSYYELKQEEEAEKEAEKSIEAASNNKERIENMHYYANQLLSSKKYEQSVDICDQILKKEEGYYPAYLIRQEACYYMRRAQQVVDDYHKAIDIYAGFYKPYLFAAKVFYNYSQYEDAKNVIDRAKENQVEFSDELKLYEARVLRNLSHSREDRKLPGEILEQLAERLTEEECDIKDKSEVPFERGLICWDDDEFEPALAFMKEAIEQNPERMQYRIVRGHIYLEMKKYKEALEEYQAAAEDYQDVPELYYNRGCTYEGLGETEAAIADFKKTLELNDRYRNTNVKLFIIYRQKYGERNRKEDFEQALLYINKQLEIRETSADYFRRALLYFDITDIEKSLADYEKSLELDPDDYVTYSNMGYCYQADRQFEKAIEYFQKAKGLMEKKSDNTRPYSQSGMCYKSMQRYDEALECFLEGAEIFPEEKDYPFWKQIGYVYEAKGEYDKAIEALENMKGISDDYYNAMAEAWIESGNPEKGLKILTDRIKEAPEDKKAMHYNELGDCYYDLLEYQNAAECYSKAISLEDDLDELYEYERSLAKTYYLMGEYEKAKEHAQKAFDHFHELGWVEEDYVNFKAYAPVRIGTIGWLYLCLGDKDKAEESFRKMNEIHLCRYCTRDKCFESSLWLGRFYETQGDYKRAIEHLEEALRRNPELVQAKKALENLRRKL